MATKTASVLTGGSNSHASTAAEMNYTATDFIPSGVGGSIGYNTGSGGTGSLAVSAQASPDMSVRVTEGYGYVYGVPTGGVGQTIRIMLAAFEDVTIAANSSGATRYDYIYAKLDPDKMANPAVAGDDVWTLISSRSTSSSTDNGTPPTYGYLLAVVTVANGASSITNSNITDKRQPSGFVGGRSSFYGPVTFQSVTSTQRDAIISPAAGMVVFNTTTGVLNFYNGSAWGAI